MNTSLTLFLQFLSFSFCQKEEYTKTHNIGKSFQFITSHNIVQLLMIKFGCSINIITYGLKDYPKKTSAMFDHNNVPFCISNVLCTLCFIRVYQICKSIHETISLRCAVKTRRIYLGYMHEYISRMFK